PGIDLVFYGSQRQLEYDLIVAPGRRPETIHFAIDGTDRIEVGHEGDLVLHTAQGEVRLLKPIVYQQSDHMREAIRGKYVVTHGNQIAFQIGSYDSSKPLIIDPVLTFSTLLGGNGADVGKA